MTQRLLTTGEIRSDCGVLFRTVLRWIAQGRFQSHRLPGGRGDDRVRLTDFLHFLRRHGFPIIPDELPEPRRYLPAQMAVAEARGPKVF